MNQKYLCIHYWIAKVQEFGIKRDISEVMRFDVGDGYCHIRFGDGKRGIDVTFQKKGFVTSYFDEWDDYDTNFHEYDESHRNVWDEE